MGIYAYWEALKRPPAYLTLIVTSWAKYQDINKIGIINQNNASRYVGGYYNLPKLWQFSLPKQSDAISAAVLYSRGGLFLDVDTVLVNESSRKIIESLSSVSSGDKFRLYGVPEKGSMHIAVIGASKNSSIANHWVKEISQILPESNGSGPWNHLGNAILEPKYRSLSDKSVFEIIDLYKSGVIAEKYNSGINLRNDQIDSRALYENYWFSDLSDNSASNEVKKILDVPDGIVMLHNSWTPAWFSDLDMNEVLESKCLLGRLLKEISLPEYYDAVEEVLMYGQ